MTTARAPSPPRERVTLTVAALSASRRVIFLVAGEEKAAAVARILGGASERAGAADAAGEGAGALPAARIRSAEGETLWLLDRAAAAGLERGRG